MSKMTFNFSDESLESTEGKRAHRDVLAEAGDGWGVCVCLCQGVSQGGNEIGALIRALARACHHVMRFSLAGSFDITRQ